MIDINLFSIKGETIGLNTHKLTVRRYDSTDKESFTDTAHYVDAEGLHELEVNFVPKHRLYEITDKEELDTSEYAWMDGIQLRTDNPAKEIAEIAGYGSIEAYNASLDENRDAYMLDLDCRLAMVELGI